MSNSKFEFKVEFKVYIRIRFNSMVKFSHLGPTLVEFCINFVPKFEKWSFLTLKLFKFDQKWLFWLEKQQVLTEYAFFWPKNSSAKGRIWSNLALKKSNLIELEHGAQIRLNSKIEFCIQNSKFRNSNEIEQIRPSLEIWQKLGKISYWPSGNTDKRQ